VPERPGLLLTGATGVLGRALLPLLAAHEVVALTHRADAPPGSSAVRGDLTRPRLGLDERTYRELVGRATTVVHCAAVTDFSVGEPGTSALNVDGTRRLLDLAADAGARVLYVSTAFVGRADRTPEGRGSSTWDTEATPTAYLTSKRRAEALVRGSGLDWTIARPSIVIGDSVTGAIARYQGLHSLIRGIVRDQVPIIAGPATSPVDVVPADVAAAALAALLDSSLPGEHWLTAGPAAPTIEHLVDIVLRTAQAHGLDPSRPRFATQDMVHRLIRPVFIEPLPARNRLRFDELTAMCAIFEGAPLLPTSLGRLPGGPAAPSRASVDAALAVTATEVARRVRGGRRAPRTGEAAA
jgi:nucleoside-diphosphate-sugar epimerase